jgi:toxin ParE1/3/4
MAQFRLARRAEADLRQILATSDEQWGAEGRRRYAAILAAAMRRIAANPKGPATRDRGELSPSVRSFHIRHARRDTAGAKVRRPVHVLFYRTLSPDLVEIVRILHERMEPGLHLGVEANDQ